MGCLIKVWAPGISWVCGVGRVGKAFVGGWSIFILSVSLKKTSYRFDGC